MKKPIGIAHRGFAGMAPENTLISFQKALECQPDAIECDVHLSSDNQLVIIHDHTLERTTNGKGKVSEISYSQLKKLDAGSWFSKTYKNEKIPLLEELIELTKDKCGLCIELKGSHTAEPTVQLIQKYDILDQVTVFSFLPEEIILTKKLNPSIPTLFLRYFDPKKPETLKINQLTRDILRTYANLLGINKDIVTHELIEKMHKRGIMVGSYTVNDESNMKKLIEMDIDGIVSDYPDKLMELLRK